jgi:hypothetical protein
MHGTSGTLPAAGDNLNYWRHEDRGVDDEEGWHSFTIVPDEVWCFDSRVSPKRKRINRAKLKL